MLLLIDPDMHTLVYMDKPEFAALNTEDCYAHKNAATDTDVSSLQHALPLKDASPTSTMAATC